MSPATGTPSLLPGLARKGASKQRLAARVIRQPELLREVLEGLSAEQAGVRYGCAKIALAKPRLADKIAKELLKVARARYRTPDCRNVALGRVIEAFDQFFDQVEHKEPVIRLVKRQRRNPRDATRKKARRFVKRRLNPNPAGA
jgi:hypothetical protein